MGDLTTALSDTADEIGESLDRVLTAASAFTISEQAQTLTALVKIRDSVLRLCCRRQREIPPVQGLLATMPHKHAQRMAMQTGIKNRSANSAARRAAKEASEQQTAMNPEE